MFKLLIKFELKRLLTKWNFFIFILIFIILAGFSYDGISDYKTLMNSKKPFQEMEKNKVKMHIHYAAYGTRGVRFLFMPGPLSVIFNDSSVFENLAAQVDTGEGFFISNSLKGKELFNESDDFFDLAGIMLLLSSFIALLYGFNINRDNDYIQLLASRYNLRNPIFLLILARMILLSLIIWALSGVSLVWLLLNSIPATNSYYLIFVLVLTIINASLLLMGSAISRLKGWRMRFFLLVALYFVFVILIPKIPKKVVYMEAKNSIDSIFDFEYKTFQYMIKFEKRFYKRFGVFKSGSIAPESIKDIIQSGQDNEYMELKKLETERFENLLHHIKKYQTLSAFIPTSFYYSTSKELSSRGFQGFVNFYRYAYDMKFKFIKFYIDKRFYHHSQKPGVESFIKGDENLFYAKSHLPDNFGLGIAINFIWLICLSGLNWFLFDSAKKQKYLDSLQTPVYLSELEPEEDAINAVITSHRDDYSKYIERLRLQNLRFLVIPDWHTLTIQSDIKVQWIFQLYDKPVPEILKPYENKYLHQLEPEELAMIYTELVRNPNAKVILFNDFAMGLSDNFIKGYFSEFLTSLKAGRSVVYFSRSIDVCGKFVEKVTISSEY